MLPYLTALFVLFWQWNNWRRWRSVFLGRRLKRSSTFWGKKVHPVTWLEDFLTSKWPGSFTVLLAFAPDDLPHDLSDMEMTCPCLDKLTSWRHHWARLGITLTIACIYSTKGLSHRNKIRRWSSLEWRLPVSACGRTDDLERGRHRHRHSSCPEASACACKLRVRHVKIQLHRHFRLWRRVVYFWVRVQNWRFSWKLYILNRFSSSGGVGEFGIYL